MGECIHRIVSSKLFSGGLLRSGTALVEEQIPKLELTLTLDRLLTVLEVIQKELSAVENLSLGRSV